MILNLVNLEIREVQSLTTMQSKRKGMYYCTLKYMRAQNSGHELVTDRRMTASTSATLQVTEVQNLSSN